jgi:predicted small lipoprotein YifL
MKSQIAAITLAGILSLGMVGCGQKAPEAETKTEQTQATDAKKDEKTEQKSDSKTEQNSSSSSNSSSSNSSSSSNGSSSQSTNTESSSSASNDSSTTAGGTEFAYSSDDAIQIATTAMGAGGQAKGQANNVTVSGPTEGGGTTYYVVEFDLGDVHYSVNVDATDGHVYNATQVFNGQQMAVEDDGTPIEGTEVDV